MSRKQAEVIELPGLGQSPMRLTDHAAVLHHEGINIAVVEITPELAAEWLRDRASNRKPRAAQVDKIYRAITNGEWLLTHQGIAFSLDGHLIDGQHRLEAIVRAGVSVPAVVAWGLSPQTMRVIDTGTTRTVADVLTILGEADARRRAADVRCLAEFFTGCSWVLSPSEVQRLLKWCGPTLEWIRDVTEHGGAVERSLLSAPIRAALMLGYARDTAKAQQFADKYRRITVAASNEPPMLLRELVITNPVSGGAGQAERLLLALSALRAHFADEPRQMLRPLGIEPARAFFKRPWERLYGPWPLQPRPTIEADTREAPRRRTRFGGK